MIVVCTYEKNGLVKYISSDVDMDLMIKEFNKVTETTYNPKQNIKLSGDYFTSKNDKYYFILDLYFKETFNVSTTVEKIRKEMKRIVSVNDILK